MPENKEEIKRILKEAYNKHEKIRVVGAGKNQSSFLFNIKPVAESFKQNYWSLNNSIFFRSFMGRWCDHKRPSHFT